MSVSCELHVAAVPLIISDYAFDRIGRTLVRNALLSEVNSLRGVRAGSLESIS